MWKCSICVAPSWDLVGNWSSKVDPHGLERSFAFISEQQQRSRCPQSICLCTEHLASIYHVLHYCSQVWLTVSSYSCHGVCDAKVFYVFVDVAYTCKLVGKLFPFTPSLIFTPVCAFLPLFLCHVSWRVSCEQITKSMQSRGMFSKAYFDLEVHPTDQVLFLRAQNLFFFQFVLFASTLHSFQLWLYGPFFFVYQPLWPFKPLSLLHLIDWCTVTS